MSDLTLQEEYDLLKECHDDHYQSYLAVCGELGECREALRKSSMPNQWTWDVPTEPGWYWFCGVLWWGRIEMVPVKVRRIANGFMYRTIGEILYPHHGECNGVWQPVDVPDTPMFKVEV